MTTFEQYEEKTAQREEMFVRLRDELEPVLLAEGAEQPLSSANEAIQRSVVEARCPEYKALVAECTTLWRRWSGEGGMLG